MTIDTAIAMYNECAKPEYGVLASNIDASRSFQDRINRDYQRSLTTAGRMIDGMKRFAAYLIGKQIPTIAELMDQQTGVIENATESLGKIVRYSQQLLGHAETYRDDLELDLCDAVKKRKELEAEQDVQKKQLKSLDEECTAPNTQDPTSSQYRTTERLRLRRSIMNNDHSYAMLSRRIVNYSNEQPILDNLEEIMRHTVQSCEVMQETTQHQIVNIKRIRLYAAAASSQAIVAEIGNIYHTIANDLQKPAEKEIIDGLAKSTGEDHPEFFGVILGSGTSPSFRIQLDDINYHVSEWRAFLTDSLIGRADCYLNRFQRETPFPHQTPSEMKEKDPEAYAPDN